MSDHGQYRPVKLTHVVPTDWITALANPPGLDPNRPKRSESGVDVRRLYDWLGRQIESERSEYCEEAANLDVSAGTMYRAEAFAEVRRQMRRFDKSLPRTGADRI